ncbi:MAG: PD40 domain-containing protein [Rhodothermia bacterium]|nr:PD40 domain-containing protein [Rhodothermia bacterium]
MPSCLRFSVTALRRPTAIGLICRTLWAAFLLTAAAVPAASQIPYIVEGDPELLVGAPGTFAMNGRWSTDARSPLIAYTSENYRGLWITNTETNVTRQVTAERAAGFGYKWSRDGSVILARVAEFDGARRRDALALFSTDSTGSLQLSTPSPRIRSLPEWTSGNDAIVVLDRDKATRIPSPLVAGKMGVEPSESFVASGNAVLRIGPDGSRQERLTFDSAVLNLTMSPDYDHLAFEVLGGDLYVARSDGTSLVSLGHGSRPAWSPDGRFVVFMKTNDNGHEITSSELMIGSAEGEVLQLTNTANVHEMNPSWSADGTRISYDFDGRIFALSIEEN